MRSEQQYIRADLTRRRENQTNNMVSSFHEGAHEGPITNFKKLTKASCQDYKQLSLIPSFLALNLLRCQAIF